MSRRRQRRSAHDGRAIGHMRATVSGIVLARGPPARRHAMRHLYSINTALIVAIAGGCSTSNDDVFNDIPREVEQEYADELRELGLDVSLERMELVAPFRSIASLDAITASSLSR